MDLDYILGGNYLKSVFSNKKPVSEYFLGLMLLTAIRAPAESIHLKLDEYSRVQYFMVAEGTSYEQVPIPAPRFYDELKSRAQNPNERRFIARYEGKNHLVDISVRADEDKREMLELKIAA